MVEENKPKEWLSNENLPRGFTEWIKDYIRENEVYHQKGFQRIAGEIGVNPSNLSRWIAGKGPLTQHDIRLLAYHLSDIVYSFLGLYPPDMDGETQDWLDE